MTTHTLREVNAPYTVDPDDEAIERETIIIQRNGEPVAVMAPVTDGQLTETLVTAPDGRVLGGILPPGEYDDYRQWRERQTQAPAPAPTSPEAIVEREYAAFQRLLPELLKAHRGEWVAIVDEQPVQFGPDFKSVILPVRQRFGKRPVCVQEIRETPRVHKILSPRVVRR